LGTPANARRTPGTRCAQLHGHDTPIPPTTASTLPTLPVARWAAQVEASFSGERATGDRPYGLHLCR
jgi:hypothetical protein